jgi:hypothetical protein
LSSIESRCLHIKDDVLDVMHDHILFSGT